MANFRSALQASKKDKTTKPKSNVGVISNIPNEIVEKANKFVNLKKDEKRIQAEMNEIYSDIDQFVTKERDKDGFSGNYHKSYQVTEELKHVQSNRFSISPKDKENIKRMLGDSFDELIKEKFTVTLKEEVFEDEKKQKQLMELLGDKFEEFFETTSSLVVTEDFDKNIYKVTKNQNSLDETRVFIKPYKAALK